MEQLKLYLLPSLTLAAFLACAVTAIILVFTGGANPIYLGCTVAVATLLGYRFFRRDIPAVWEPLLAKWL